MQQTNLLSETGSATHPETLETATRDYFQLARPGGFLEDLDELFFMAMTAPDLSDLDCMQRADLVTSYRLTKEYLAKMEALSKTVFDLMVPKS
ncbi:MAG: hypothetical protein IPG12_14210 [Saprospiraceae bacterium]|nr:hypothetical protein [Saprospiraceae bacterium]